MAIAFSSEKLEGDNVGKVVLDDVAKQSSSRSDSQDGDGTFILDEYEHEYVHGETRHADDE